MRILFPGLFVILPQMDRYSWQEALLTMKKTTKPNPAVMFFALVFSITAGILLFASWRCVGLVFLALAIGTLLGDVVTMIRK
ncbi:hypothetical protein SDC9_191641 [bioreactor metagenome]|uniref:Uncharacterized protein n=1 Tax=bioreactor metagenome TaxID=1076179 RepID=A0A645HYU4_9ZZZZ